MCIPRDAGTAVGHGWAVKDLRAMETCKNIITNYACFCAETTLTSKTMEEIIENHSEFDGCANSRNKFVYRS